MNRLSPLSGLGSLKPVRSQGSLECSVSSVKDVSGLRHAIFAPLHYERNYSYPLLVWMHGPGFDERQLQRLMPLISMRNYVAVAPRAPWTYQPEGGYCWQNNDQATTLAAQMVFDSVENISTQYNIARDRIFLAGYQCGGEVALRIGLQHPREFAGVISIGGAFPRDGSPLSRLSGARSLPMLIAHGEQSTIYPMDQMCEDLRLFHAAGLCVTLRQYPCGDEIHQRMLHDMDVWLMEQVTGQELFRCDYYHLS